MVAWGFSEPLAFIHSDFDPESEGCRPNTIYPLNSLIFSFHGNGLVYIAARHKIFQICFLIWDEVDDSIVFEATGLIGPCVITGFAFFGFILMPKLCSHLTI